MTGNPHVELTEWSSDAEPSAPKPQRRVLRWAAGACIAGAGLASVFWASSSPGRASPGASSTTQQFDSLTEELVQLSQNTFKPGEGPQGAGNVLKGLKPGSVCKAPEPTKVCQSSGKQCQHSVFADRDDCSILSINILIKQDNLDAMNAEPRKKIAQPCDVIVNYNQPNEMTFYGSKVKFKGATGSFMGCFNEMTGVATPRWRACRKLSLKVDLRKAKNAEGKSAEQIVGMGQLQLLGMMHDDTLVRNHIGCKIQQDLGLISPCSIPANVFFNGVYDGVSDLTEGIDDHYLANRFPGKEGTLWVEMWPESSSSVYYKNVKPLPGFAGRLIAHEGPDGPGYDLLANIHRDAAACVASGKLCTKARATKILEKYTYPDSFIDAFIGVALSANSDTPLVLKHNFYLFLLEQKIHYLLWDFNQVLYDVTGSPLPGYEVAKPWYHIPTEAEKVQLCPYDVPSSSTDLFQRRFAHFTCEPVGHIMALAWKDEYLSRMRNLDLEGIKEKIKNEIDTWDKRIESAVVCDGQNGGWPPSLAEMNAETEDIMPMFSRVATFWDNLANSRDQPWPQPTFADFSREVNECFFDGMQAAHYLGQIGLMITAGVRDCPHGAAARAACANDLSNVIASFSFFGSFLSGMLLHCPIRDITGLAQRGVGRLYYNTPKVECAEMSTRLAAGLASVSASVSGLSEMCVPGVARANRGLDRRLVSTGFVKNRPTEVATCTFDTIGATLWLAEAAIAIDKSTRSCHEFYHDSLACGKDVSNVVEAFSYLGMFTADSVAQCAREANFPIDKAFEATCAADIAQLIGALATISEGGNGIAHSCGRVGPFPPRIVKRGGGHRHLSGDEYMNEIENSRAAWEDVATKGDHKKLEAWLNRMRLNGTDAHAAPSAPEFTIFG